MIFSHPELPQLHINLYLSLLYHIIFKVPKEHCKQGKGSKDYFYNLKHYNLYLFLYDDYFLNLSLSAKESWKASTENKMQKGPR